MYKDFDMNMVMKLIKSKSESVDVLKDFAIMDTKINTSSENVMYLRKDVDNLVVIYRKLIQNLQQQGTMQESASMLTTKKLHAV